MDPRSSHAEGPRAILAAMAETARKHVVVHGEVQGVYFRDSTNDEANKQGVSGWVRNRDDGTVEAVFEGDPGAVDAMVDFCRKGSSQAEVERVDVDDEEPEGLDGFEQR
jgi:acylphosphatase